MTFPPSLSQISTLTVRRITTRGEAGFTIIEVLVAALLLAIVGAGAATAFVGVVGESGIQRNRSAAEALAQQDESKLHGESVGQLANLNKTLSPVTIDGTQYTIKESANFVSDGNGNPSCTNPSADYLQTTSTVTWQGMPSDLQGATVTGLITPSNGQISSTTGVLAVDVEDAGGNPIAGMPVSVSGPGSASGVTASNGCVLFGDLPVGSTYTVNVAPTSGSYVDALTNQTVNASNPDTQANQQVSAGTTASTPNPFQLASPGAATFSFSDLWPTGVAPSPAPTATSPSVVLASGKLSSPSAIVCSNQDTSGCPSVSKADTSWGAGAWSSANGGQLTAQPLVPTTYSTYAGVCSLDDPSLPANGGVADQTTAVTSGATATTSLTLPAMVVRLYGGTGTAGVLSSQLPLSSQAGSEMGLPAGSELVVTDSGCRVHYVGGPGVSVPGGDSLLPVNSSPVLGGGTNDTGVLGYPGMPDGQYTICYQHGGKDSQVSLTNSGNGEVIDLYDGSLTTGTCAT